MTPALSAHSESEQVVDMAFLGTRAGLLRSSLFVGSEKVSDKRFLTPADEDSMFTLDHFPLWYRQAAEHPPGSMVFNLRSAEGPESPSEPAVVTVSTAVAVSVDNRTAIAAGMYRSDQDPLSSLCECQACLGNVESIMCGCHQLQLCPQHSGCGRRISV
ncbi:hypothetical protein MJG53_003985 [Ovis ammon polii x Ovis aries]|uniref:Uncharacterized protein n=1 Tax=Ovis ammon polii x Ovis aries TaxID=2918886 RepID=A0ACB9V8Z5_9CETA|nr:hypothetical protein MJG53_003985 [Ovis ammon polii x Ovis aries]